MPDTVADVLVSLGVDTAGLREGFRQARTETTQFANDLSQIFSMSGGPIALIGDVARTTGGAIPGPLGAAVRGIGSVISAIGRAISGIFTRAARRIAREIQRSFQETVNAYNAGGLTLAETIRRIEQERENAIRRLSGKKGGRKELDKLLPDFDRTLAELQARQRAILEQFEASLDLLRTGEAFRGSLSSAT